jgi:cytochrome c
MKKQNFLLIAGTTLLLTGTLYAQDGAVLFEAKCATCHQTSRPSDMSTLVAPPVMGVMRHVKMKYTTKEDAVAFIANYALNPEESKAVCMPQKIKRFGLMPSQTGKVSKEELHTIAAWMYENFPSKESKKMGKNHKEGKNCQAH